MRVPLVAATDPILYAPVPRVTDFAAPEVDLTSRQLIVTVISEGGLGLAAPQIGVALAMFVAFTEVGTLLAINPHLEGIGTEMETRTERCLSLPGVSVEVPRHRRVRLAAYNIKGAAWEVELDGMDARIVQHEFDHLHGKLITHYERHDHD